jgi:RNA polymerase sigma factor (sigma-70 family)
MTHQNRTAIADFFMREYGRLAGFVRTLIDEAAEFEGEDIVQDVALNLFAKADITAPVEDIASYVYRALRNRVIDRFRSRQKTVSLDRPLNAEEGGETLKDILADESMDLELIIDSKEIKQRVFGAIETLPDEQKAVLIATEFDGKGFAELSSRWEVPLGTLLARKSRAIAKLRKTLMEKKP